MIWYNLYKMYKEDAVETITVSEARRSFAEIITQVAFAGKRLIVERHGRPAAALISYADLLRLQQLEKREAEKEGWREALDRAEALTARMLAERHGEYLPDVVEVIRESREQRTDELTNRS